MSRETMQRFYEGVVNEGRLELVDELTKPDVIDHETMDGKPTSGPEPVKEFFAEFRQGFPDLRATVEDMLEDGDQVVARVRFTGTQEGEFMGIPATGKRIDIETIDVVRFEDGLAAEHWGVTDQLRMMQQLGVIPEEARA
jgi:steroid delta-isomerase-like uncharacterized protein